MHRLFGKKSTSRRSTSTPQSTDEAPPEQSTDEYLRVVDDNPHASDGKTSLNKQGDRFKLRGNWKRLHLFYVGLSKFEQIKAVIDVAGWSRLLSVDMPNSDQRLVESCVERWWDTTHTFHLPLVEFGISPYDFTFITGMYMTIDFICILRISHFSLKIMLLYNLLQVELLVRGFRCLNITTQHLEMHPLLSSATFLGQHLISIVLALLNCLMYQTTLKLLLDILVLGISSILLSLAEPFFSSPSVPYSSRMQNQQFL